MKNKKGQAAMEYLMTYGWVLISILVIIAVLISSGIFNTGKFINQECKITPDFPCLTPVREQIGGTYKIRFNVTNGLGHTIVLQGIKMRDLTTGVEINNAGGSPTGYVNVVGSLRLSPGDSIVVAAEFNGQAPGELRTFYLNFDYQRINENGIPTDIRFVSGRIKAKIEPE